MNSLEALERIRRKLSVHYDIDKIYEWSIVDDDFNDIEKSLKALEIIKEKKVNIFTFYECCSWYNASHYNDSTGCPINCELTREEYELLKEVLKWN